MSILHTHAKASAGPEATKGFFAVDRRAWARVCALGLNPAVAYLVVACGTGGDNRTTKWWARCQCSALAQRALHRSVVPH